MKTHLLSFKQPQFNSFRPIRASLFVLLFALAAHADSPVYLRLHDFNQPSGGLILSERTLYGTASPVYPSHGSVFKLRTDGGGYTELKQFNGFGDGDQPNGLCLSGTTLFGTTLRGGTFGYGTLFKLNTDGTGFTVLNNFDSYTAYPVGNLVLSGATLYGETGAGGDYLPGYGTVFKIATDGSGFTVLKSFDGGLNGNTPSGGLVLSGTTLYGETITGGNYGDGTVFKLNTDGSGFVVLKSFNHASEGYNPRGPLLLSGSTLFGTTPVVNTYDFRGGTVFKLNTDGSGYVVLTNLPPSMGAQPNGGLLLFGNTLYGTTIVGCCGTPNNGLVFRINTDGSDYSVFWPFENLSEGRPSGGMVSSGTPTFYGTTLWGGISNNGVLFELSYLTITREPQSRIAALGSTVNFGVQVLGVPPLSYQWFFNGTNRLGGATGSVLQLTDVQTANSGYYSVIVTNSYGSLTSSIATLDVIPPVTTVVTNLTDAALRSAIAQGGTVLFRADGTLGLTNTLTIANDTVLDGTGHHVTISGASSFGLIRVNPLVHFSATNLVFADGRATNGGALYNDGGTVNLIHDVLTGNAVTNLYSEASGGAVFNAAGTVDATDCTFAGNTASGWTSPGVPGAGGLGGQGAAILNLGDLIINRCSFLQNSATGGTGQWGTFGGTLGNGGPGGAGGFALGGAVCSLGTLTLNASLFASNSVVGGNGGWGGPGGSLGCSVGNGGPGGFGGNALGAGLYATGTCAIVNCTFVRNNSTAGAGGGGGAGGSGLCHGQVIHGANGGNGGNGAAIGGACVTSGLCNVTNCTVALNQGGGIRIDGGGAVSLVNTLLYFNAPGSDSIGRPIDLGHNISSDSSCAFTNVGSLNNTDPRLAPLADNGGPTWTMALLWASPAIDAGDTAAAPPTDQRGYTRPLGLAPDIGAYEYGLPVSLQVSVTPNGRVNIMVCAAPSQLCHLLASSDLVNWELFGINIAGPGGTAFFQDDTKGSFRRFYRALLP